MIKKLSIPLIGIILLAVVLRFFWLDKIPNGINGDELGYIVNAKSIILSGRDVTGTWNPWSALIFRYPPFELQAELPFFLHIPTVYLIGVSLFSAKVLFAFMSVMTVVGVYFLTKELFDRRMGLIAAALMAINPWSIFIGRTAYEMVPAVCFYIWGIYLFLLKKKYAYIAAALCFLLGFYAYIGTKVLLIPLIGIVALYTMSTGERKLKNPSIVFIVGSILFTLFFYIALTQGSSTSRISQLISPNNPEVASLVDNARQLTIDNPVAWLYENKLTTVVSIIMTKMFRTLSFEYLFVKGDIFFAFYRHGLFYWIDALFLCIGVVMVFKNQAKKGFLVVGLMLIGILPHLLHGISVEDFSPHIVMIIPFAVMIIAYGIYSIKTILPRRLLFLASALVLALYIFSAGRFLHQYWFQQPLGGNYDFSLRLLSSYVLRAKDDRPVTVYVRRPHDVYKKYLFYADQLQTESLSDVRNSFNTSEFALPNIQIKGCDEIDPFDDQQTTIYESVCLDATNSDLHDFATITRLNDGGEEYRIYSDELCRYFNLSKFVSNVQINNFSVEQLATQQFCEAYIGR